MRITKNIVLSVLGSMAVALQAGAADQGMYLKLDAGVSFPQDLEIKQIGGLEFPRTLTSFELEDLTGINVPAGTYSVQQPKIALDVGFRVDVAGGFQLNESLAIELEAGVVWNEGDTMEVAVDSPLGGASSTGSSRIDFTLWQIPILANLVYTLPLESKFKPYIGAGAGGIVSLVDVDSDIEEDFTFAYQGMAGINYQISETMEIGIGYKFLGTLEQEFDDVKIDPVFTHAVLANFVFRF